jgi:hypothetical protein
MTTFTTGPTFIQINFNGLASSGGISVPGLEVGDIVLWVSDGINGNTVAAFEAQISVADEIQQAVVGASRPFNGIVIRWAQQ